MKIMIELPYLRRFQGAANNMTQNTKIREFTEHDLDSVVRLVHRVVDVCYTPVYPAGALALYKRYHSRENILSDAWTGYCVVAEKGSEIVGTGTLIEADVRRVYVNPDCQNTGIGGMVYDALEKRAVEARISRLDLSASIIARRFWESQGFVFESEQTITAPNNEILLFYLMSKSFPAGVKII